MNNLSKEGKTNPMQAPNFCMLLRKHISSALLEIENGTFHFASKEELNDPLEGFVRVFWQGDKMAWEGLFRHYIYSVARALELYILKADDETLYHGTLVADVHCYKNNFFEKILLKLGEEFITDTDVQNLAGVYSDNCLKVSEKELQYILFYIHNNLRKINLYLQRKLRNRLNFLIFHFL